MRRAILTFFGLPPRQRVMTLQAAAALVQSVVSLKLKGFRPAAERATPVGAPNSGALDRQQLDEAARAVRRGSNTLGIGTCLSRSLALRKLLDRQGIRADLRIGVGSGSREFRAHAWLEINGKPIGGESGDGYQVFDGIR